MKTYVLGFLFDRQRTKVALILKNRPVEQRGKLNGIGGLVEPDEEADVAMEREFQEETGVRVEARRWRRFAWLQFRSATVHCFEAVAQDPFCELQALTDEVPRWVSTDELHSQRLVEGAEMLVLLADLNFKTVILCHENMDRHPSPAVVPNP